MNRPFRFRRAEAIPIGNTLLVFLLGLTVCRLRGLDQGLLRDVCRNQIISHPEVLKSLRIVNFPSQ